MKLFRGIAGLRRLGADHAGGAAGAIGNFDGLHLGHQQLIRRARELGRERGAPSAILFIEPHAREVLAPPSERPPRVLPFAAKVRRMAESGIDAAVVLPFHQIRRWSAEEFASTLFGGGCLCAAVIGADFKFGAGRSGDVELLHRIAAPRGIAVEVVDNVIEAERRISSTWLRELLLAGELARAERLLGRPYAISGRVIAGQRRGRELGFPTANLRLGRPRRLCLSGVYAVRARLASGAVHAAVANVGERPTLAAGRSLEAHLLDFAGDLYGQYLTLEFVQKLRPEQRFDSVEQLRRQIERDCILAREALG